MKFRKKKATSPLDSHLASGFAGKGRRVRKRALVGVAMLVLIPYVGSSLAASVAISGRGGGGAIEFAQGSQTTIVCDSTIITTIDSSYFDNSGNGYFKVDTITLSGINTTSATTATISDQGCGGKKLTITVYKTVTGTTSLAVIGSNSPGTEVSIIVPTSAGSITSTNITPSGTGITAVATIPTATTGEIVITLPPALATPIDASTVSRIGIETS